MKRRNSCKEVTSMVLGFFECVFFGAIVMGWPNLVFIFKDAGIFSHLCPLHNLSLPVPPDWNSTENTTYAKITCSEMDRMYSLVHSLTTALSPAATFPIGLLFDRYGFWATRISATFFFIAGSLFLAFAAPGSSSYLLFPGLILQGIGGMHITLTVMQLALQAGDKTSMVATIYSGGVDSGVVVYLIVKLLYENHGIGHRASLGFLTGMWVIVLINTFAFCPRYKVTLTPPGDILASESKEDIVKVSEDKHPMPPPSNITFRECLKTPFYWMFVVWFCLIQLRFAIFVGGLNKWLTFFTDGDLQKVSHFTNVFSYMSFGGLAFAPIVGIITDQTIKRGIGSDVSVPFLGTAKASAPALWVGSALAIAHSVTSLFYSEALVYVILLLFVMMRTFLFGNGNSYMTRVFPSHILGKCFGLMFLVAGAVSCVQYALLDWVDRIQNYQIVNGVLLAIVSLSLMCPIYIESVYGRTPKGSPHSHTTISPVVDKNTTLPSVCDKQANPVYHIKVNNNS